MIVHRITSFSSGQLRRRLRPRSDPISVLHSRTFALLVAMALTLSACGDQRSTPTFSGSGDLLASGRALGETWRITCSIDHSANGMDQSPGGMFGPAPVGACAPDGNPHPCVTGEFRGSSMTLCQLEDLSEKLLVSHSFPVGDDQWLFFGVVDPRVANLEFELMSGPNIRVKLADPSNARFKLFATALSESRGKLLLRPILRDSEGNPVTSEGA